MVSAAEDVLVVERSSSLSDTTPRTKGVLYDLNIKYESIFLNIFLIILTWQPQHFLLYNLSWCSIQRPGHNICLCWREHCWGQSLPILQGWSHSQFYILHPQYQHHCLWQSHQLLFLILNDLIKGLHLEIMLWAIACDIRQTNLFIMILVKLSFFP